MNITESCTALEYDGEVENLLVDHSRLNQVEADIPLSPILTASINRKYFRGSCQRKSRVKLSERFEIKNCDKLVENVDEDSFSLSVRDNENLERLEEIEENRKLAYKQLINNRKNKSVGFNKINDVSINNKQDSCFKKPISPALKRKLKEEENHNITENDTSFYDDNICVIPNVELPKTSNFQTATGKSIEIPPHKLQQHSKLFDDIISCSQIKSVRENKYTFLKKSQSTQSSNNNSINSFDNSHQTDGDISISDTQMLFAAESILHSISDTTFNSTNFLGFSKSDLLESEMLLKKLKSACNKQVKKNNSLRRKRDTQEVDFPPLKKLKQDYRSPNCSAGYSMASGSGMTASKFGGEEGKRNRENVPEINFKKCRTTKEKLRFFDNLVGDNRRDGDGLKPPSPSKKTESAPFFNGTNVNSGFSKASGHGMNANRSSKATKIFEDIDLSDLKNPQSSTNSAPSNAFNKASSLVKNGATDAYNILKKEKQVPNFRNFVTDGTAKKSQPDYSHRQISIKDKLKYFDRLIGDDGEFVPKSEPIPKKTVGEASRGASSILDEDVARERFDTPVKTSATKKPKKNLGLSVLRPIAIPRSKLERAKLLFEEDFAGISPIKPVGTNFPSLDYCSTPLKNVSDIFADRNDSVAEEEPITDEICRLGEHRDVTFDTPRSKDADDYDDELRKLEERFVELRKRREAVEELKREKIESDKKPKRGVLHESKSRDNRVDLKAFTSERKPTGPTEDDLFCITPRNVVEVHFKEPTIVSTEDGATVVPNLKDLIGVCEIGKAFFAMPGTDSRLIPKNWVKNHYKWIVWKLTSYERMFPDRFKGSLTVEQVVQQLKYRYDREIDRAERSALRKILEKDDAPQRRLVLCVSDIKKLEKNFFELDLTDGWYSIRTVIDEPLCRQVLKEKIKIGTKLITYGSKIINCDGCHPLDITETTYLSINFNCTRRAKWDTKLGYQKCPGPFPVPVYTLHHNGGTIGRIDVCVARSYPFRYLEKTKSKSVWRNKKAEDLSAQIWENERYKQFEEIEKRVRREFDSNIQDGSAFEQQLTLAQKSSSLTEKSKMVKREVAVVMKLLVIDINGSPTKSYNFHLWNPSEMHAQVLKEGSCHSIIHSLPKGNGDLSSGQNTTFKRISNVECMSEIYRRKLTAIADLDDFKFSCNFKEFDTIGLVVQSSIESDRQEVWMCDTSGRLLQVTVAEGPGTCVLLENVKRGQLVSACNLVYCGLSAAPMVCKSSANQFTVFSSYPKFKHLQDGLDRLKNELPKDKDDLLKGCDTRIEMSKSKGTSNVFEESCDDSTLISSRLTSTDIALSLIDIDKFM